MSLFSALGIKALPHQFYPYLLIETYLHVQGIHGWVIGQRESWLNKVNHEVGKGIVKGLKKDIPPELHKRGVDIDSERLIDDVAHNIQTKGIKLNPHTYDTQDVVLQNKSVCYSKIHLAFYAKNHRQLSQQHTNSSLAKFYLKSTLTGHFTSARAVGDSIRQELTPHLVEKLPTQIVEGLHNRGIKKFDLYVRLNGDVAFHVK